MVAFFEEQVRPVLAEHCYDCHGPEKKRGELRVDSLAGLLAGGESGPAVSPGEPADSLLIEAIRYESFEMPPSGKLKDEQVAAITKWVEMGAPWPGHDGSVREPSKKKAKITDEDRAYWAFQTVRDVQPPAVKDNGWCRNDVDRFVLRRLLDLGLQPSQQASRLTLVRRVYSDLIGLPPTPEEIDAFLADTEADAYERLVDRLLSSPRYGERWARHWLDLVRYAESDGFRQDAFRPHVWRYRDYVVRSFNEDKPYDQFILEQIAGDEIAPHDPDALAATTYLRHWIYEYNQRDVRTQWENTLIDITNVTGEVFLGVGIGCARCHDHKFDPILQEDYYRLKAFFTPLLPREDLPFATGDQWQAYQTQQAAWEEKTAEIRRQIDEIQQPLIEQAKKNAADKFPPDIRPMLLKTPADRTPLEHQLAELAYRQGKAEVQKINFASQLKGEQKLQWERLQAELAKFADLKPKALPPAFTVTDVGPRAPPTVIPGDRQQREIEPGFLTVLDPHPAEIPPDPSGNSTGRRTALARWLASPENPLTTRVIVNRMWQQHFGVGLVSTASDFGHLGETPTHPELLDWLASRFVEDRWRFKPLHRLIVTSATYRQASLSPGATGESPVLSEQHAASGATGVSPVLSDQHAASGATGVSPVLSDQHGQDARATDQHGQDARATHQHGQDARATHQHGQDARATRQIQSNTAIAERADPGNRLLWRMGVRRLDAEQIRDAMLAASGELDLTEGGSSVSSAAPRRSIYCQVIRNSRDPLIAVFDGADGFSSIDRRNVTTTPTQALLMINGAWPLKRAEAFAARLRKMRHTDDGELVEAAYRLAYGRSPTRFETDKATQFLLQQAETIGRQRDEPAGQGVVAAMPGRDGDAAVLAAGSSQERLIVPNNPSLPSEDFTAEAVILLRSLYKDATVRTIVSHWDDNSAHPGWALGVTSAKSSYQPRNLILQLVGDPAKGGAGYEVIASNLRPELNKPYYVAASVRIAEAGPAGVTFYLKDLSQPNSPLQTAQAAHKVTAHYRSPSALVVGGRDGSPRHLWDGSVDDLRLSNAALEREQLLLYDDSVSSHTVGFWRFETDAGFYSDASGSKNDLLAPDAWSSGLADPRAAAWIDFCHVLLNSNEFLYVD